MKDLAMDAAGVGIEDRACVASPLSKARALMARGEEDGGSEIVQVVIVLGFAVGLGAALMALQGNINEAIEDAGEAITNMFKSVTKGAAAGTTQG